jgi:hypothetical protein
MPPCDTFLNNSKVLSIPLSNNKLLRLRQGLRPLTSCCSFRRFKNSAKSWNCLELLERLELLELFGLYESVRFNDSASLEDFDVSKILSMWKFSVRI